MNELREKAIKYFDDNFTTPKGSFFQMDGFTFVKHLESFIQSQPINKELGGWISVEDRLPCNYGEYLCVCNYKKVSYVKILEVFRDSSDDKYYFDLYFQVTHWMPLPNPPKK